MRRKEAARSAPDGVSRSMQGRRVAILRTRWVRAVPGRVPWLVALAGTAGCAGMQSALEPAGGEATRLAALFWLMTAGAVVIWAAVVALGWYYGRPHEGTPSRRRDRWLILGAGVAVPLVVLTALLAHGLRMLPPLVARAPEGSLTVHVAGEQWWWRVRYETTDGRTVETANEIRLPVGAPVQFVLSSDNVLHAFWVPALGGKMDMIPGRTTYLALHPTRTGTFAGVCAEYCGTSHGYMRLMVQVMERDDFDAWLARQQAPAAEPVGMMAQRGRDVMLRSGCGACHSVRGTDADGVIAPDLTHVGDRLTLGAGLLRTDASTLARWIAAPGRLKPGVHMPAFEMLGDDDVRALAAYLEQLR